MPVLALASNARTGAALGAAGFRRWATYRQAAVAGIFTNCVFGVFIASVLTATVESGGGSVAGYDVRGAATNVWVAQGLFAVVQMYAWNELADRVHSGEIAVDLARPVDLQLSWLAADLGRAAYAMLSRFAAPILVGAVFYALRWPGSPGRWVGFAVSVTLAVVISFACRFAVSLVAFWLVDVRGIVTFYVLTATLVGGLIVPVHLFPEWARTVAFATPFPAMLQLPVDLWVGRGDVVTVLATQLAWVVVTLAVGRGVLARAVRRLVVQGG